MAKPVSTYERYMQDAEFKKEYQKEYKKFLFSELLCALMDNDHKSVRVLAEQCGVSAKIIQNLRTGKQKDLKLSTFFKVIEVFGYQAFIEKGNEKIPLFDVIEETEDFEPALPKKRPPPPRTAYIPVRAAAAAKHMAKHKVAARRKEA